MHQFYVKVFQFFLIEFGLRAADFSKVQRCGQRFQIIKRFNGFRSAEFGQKRTDGHRLNTFGAQFADPQTAQTFGQFSFFSGQQRQMRKSRHPSAQSFKHLNLRSRVGYMIFSANNMRNAKINVINNRRQMIQKASVFTDNNRVAQFFGFIADFAANHIVPFDFARKQFKTIMRFASFRFIFGNIFRRITQSLAIINRRQAFGQSAFSFKFQFFRRFIAGINPAFRFQSGGYFVIAFKASRLPGFFTPNQTQPFQVIADNVFIFFFRPLFVGVINTKHKFSAELLSPQPVKQGRTGIADMHKSGRARRKSYFYISHLFYPSVKLKG